MSFKFEAEPKVVLNRAKYRTNETTGGPNSQEYGSSYATVMKDARVKVLNPSQQEEEFVRLEKERIKLENMQKQLVSFKQSKKMSPYNIKPSPQPKVSANLTFFLTDATDVKPPQTNVEIQADIFKERPKTPQYVPKKTGRDVSTQIEDNELFNFDREVTPIISVICTKTIEQSMIEIEEEEELSRIKKFKEEYWKRREEDEQKWKGMLQKELDAISTKEKKLEEFRLKEDTRIKVLRKLQSYQVARTYLRDLQFNSISYLHKNGLYVNEEREELVNKVPSFFVDGVIKTLGQRQTVRSDFTEAFNHIEGELLARREIADKQFKKDKKRRESKESIIPKLKDWSDLSTWMKLLLPPISLNSTLKCKNKTFLPSSMTTDPVLLNSKTDIRMERLAKKISFRLKPVNSQRPKHHQTSDSVFKISTSSVSMLPTICTTLNFIVMASLISL